MNFRRVLYTNVLLFCGVLESVFAFFCGPVSSFVFMRIQDSDLNKKYARNWVAMKLERSQVTTHSYDLISFFFSLVFMPIRIQEVKLVRIHANPNSIHCLTVFCFCSIDSNPLLWILLALFVERFRFNLCNSSLIWAGLSSSWLQCFGSRSAWIRTKICLLDLDPDPGGKKPRKCSGS